MRRRFLTGKPGEGRNMPDIVWHGAQLNMPLWDDHEARILAFTLAGISESEPDLHIVLNMSDKAATMELPVVTGREWCLAVDTAKQSPDDMVAPQDQHAIITHYYPVNSQTVVVFENRGV